ncbi:protein kinase [Actinocorallia sp. API 0066]|uniref:protein kinase n=1 Tax=Actinocorallia sp. API 0066 TaxID=2896846 RepID=UPI001E303900|nr:protein kinase [Actinocorallia sp. API 0066]MCD0448853.1 protein kinase [Actinocorallia sp. API 0066]
MNPELPAGLVAAITPHTGTVESVTEPTERGRSSDITKIVEGRAGRFFVKGVRGDERRRARLLREAAINPYVLEFSPPVLWQTEHEDWLVLGFEVLEGFRSLDFKPGSHDLPLIVDTLNRISALPLPDIAQDWQETRWNRYITDNEDTTLLQGETLLYTDIHASNLLYAQGRTWAIDWSWPTIGAAVIDPCMLIIQLLGYHFTPAEAEDIASGCTAWQHADPKAIDAFITATIRLYTRSSKRAPEEDWLKVILTDAQTWAEHRGIRQTEK